MKEGIYAAQVSGGTVRAIHIDQERLEMESMNRKVQNRIDKAASEKRAEARRAERQRQKVDKLSDECLRLAISLAVLAALAFLGLVNWILAAVAVAIGLIAFGSKLGRMAAMANEKTEAITDGTEERNTQQGTTGGYQEKRFASGRLVVLQDLIHHMIIRHKITGEVKVIDK